MLHKQNFIHFIRPLLVVLAIISGTSNLSYAQSSKVEIVRKPDGFKLLRNGQPYFVKGVVGFNYPDKIKNYGANSVRMAIREKQKLDEAHQLGLSVLVNLPLLAQRNKMDYDDTAAVRQQHQKVISLVKELKDHPAVLMWALGNELDHIGHNVPYNFKVWDAVNNLAREIHKIDPNHPVMTVVGSITEDKVKRLMLQAPELDLLGINEYGDLEKAPAWLRQWGWNKPYIPTEWGPTGFWQVPKTSRKIPVEETSSMKADIYQRRYQNVMVKDKEMCLGSYVFLWRQHQELTHTWFGLFDENGLDSEAVDVMRYQWNGKWPANRAPRIDGFTVNGKTGYDNIELAADQSHKAKILVRDPDKDKLRYAWEILPEPTVFGYGGKGEKKPDAIPNLVKEPTKSEVVFKSPTQEGNYRIFVYIYDDKGHFATANIPFYVTAKK